MVQAQRTHRLQLRTFACADPEKRSWDAVRGKLTRPRECGLRVQSDVRASLRPPRQKPEYLFVAVRDGKVVGVLNFYLDHDANAAMVLVLARSLSVCGQGVGQAAIDQLRLLLADLAPGMRVVARIAPSNGRSATLFAANGFSLEDRGEMYDLWERPSFEDAAQAENQAETGLTSPQD